MVPALVSGPIMLLAIPAGTEMLAWASLPLLRPLGILVATLAGRLAAKECAMPKGDIRLRNGVSVHYDDVRRDGDLVIFKRAYSHDVETVHACEVEEITDHEWHQTPFGSCKQLSESEVRDAVRRHAGK